ncbi:hypothetical protein HQ325_03205 [Rhodococcus sp. BP-349]|uniref:DUF6668 family protein n=1 Tax=unclassified Rhodococcus (in: high G+C Gram-positive bacteria) TaxID=192944 RepID=UPI001C9A66CF|nr:MULTISPECIES: DUF6668 family protein [unclassified Rhodococcus (in: high G+C Gram-positive bacteria)]MBY6537672.1 hypothetical protein [Rhodococcus sp. BP-363]MBY6542009.1 hypothetical protein [Rhodococcus sp. BP-369]MBY6561239.1 hypothetical protein [Rhodococcus sp. BP-370]MBY6575531.1 hypothetical protein [Rhodococcus sp. BP-364]MBY6584832.1 hypothetical protein [Rhodococcus sp. BP-358]
MAAQPINDHELYSDDTSGSAPVVPAGLRIPPIDRQAPVHTEPVAGVGRAPVMWLLGAHGGAGVSTLARVWAPAADAHGGWPAHDRYRSVIVVARTHRTGLAAAHDLLLQSAAGLTGGCTVLGLALVPDAPGKLPKTLRRSADVVASAAPAVWHLPWVPDLRVHTYSDLAVWSPAEPDPPPPGRMRSVTSAAAPHPGLVAAGHTAFDAARRAAAH